MTKILPATLAVAGAAAGGFWGLVAGGAIGWMARHGGYGTMVPAKGKSEVQAAVYRALAMTWAVRPVIAMVELDKQFEYLDGVWDQAARDSVAEHLTFMSNLKSYVMRAHFSGIVPNDAFDYVRKNYRDGPLRKRRKYAEAMAVSVAQIYYLSHPDPASDYAWFETWCAKIGLNAAVTRAAWFEGMQSFEAA